MIENQYLKVPLVLRQRAKTYGMCTLWWKLTSSTNEHDLSSHLKRVHPHIMDTARDYPIVTPRLNPLQMVFYHLPLCFHDWMLLVDRAEQRAGRFWLKNDPMGCWIKETSNYCWGSFNVQRMSWWVNLKGLHPPVPSESITHHKRDITEAPYGIFILFSANRGGIYSKV